MGMIHSKRFLVLLIIPTTVMLVLVGLLIFAFPKRFLWLRSIAGIWTLIYLMYFRCKIYGYKGIPSILVFVFFAAALILGFWLVPFEIVDQSALLIVGVLGLVAVYWDQLKDNLPKAT